MSPRLIRKRTDSGSFPIIIIVKIKGMTPPNSNVDRHPKVGIKYAAIKPPSDAPSGNPQNIVLTIKDRFWSGLYSDNNVTAFGIAAPKPKPVINRKISSSTSDETNVESVVPIEKIKTATINTFFLPKRSAKGPKEIAPIANPKSAALKTGANADFSSPHSANRLGAM